MKREELNARLKSVNAKIKELQIIEEPEFKTQNSFIPKIGFVHEIETLNECAKALTLIKKRLESVESSADELGLTKDEIKGNNKYLGHTIETWKNDLQKKVDEIKRINLLEKLNLAKGVLMKHRTEDDIFQDDMESIEDVLGLI